MKRLKELLLKVASVAWSFIKWVFGDLVKKRVFQWVAGVIGTALFGLFAVPSVVETVAPKDHTEELKRLRDGVNIMRSQFLSELGAYRELVTDLRAKDEAREASFWKVVDSVAKARAANIVASTTGSGQIQIVGNGPTLDGWFEDAWLTALVQPDTVNKRYNIHYDMKLAVRDVSVTLEDKNGKQTDIYRVMVQSLRDSAQYFVLPDYVRERIGVARVPEDTRRLFFDLALSGDALLGRDGLEAALLVTPLSWSLGGPSYERIITRFPSVGISTDLRTLNLAVGFRVNIAHVLPLVHDLYLSLHYIPADAIRVGIGTTL